MSIESELRERLRAIGLAEKLHPFDVDEVCVNILRAELVKDVELVMPQSGQRYLGDKLDALARLAIFESMVK